MNKMKVLVISVDVSNLSEEQISELQMAMEVQTEDFEAPILSSDTRLIDENGDEFANEEDDRSNLH